MTPGGLPASLPGRLTDRLEQGQDLAGAGLVVGGARGFPLSAAGSTSMTWYGVFSDLSSTTGMVLGTNIINIVPFRKNYFARVDSTTKNVGG